tara:strand:+ start:5395 stop:5547 length:153 start_codon:yes stop_codon:yes gene_type:complete
MGKMNDLLIEKLENMTEEERIEYEHEDDLKEIAVQEYLEQEKEWHGDDNE